MCLFDCHKYRADISDYCSLAQHAINKPESQTFTFKEEGLMKLK